MLWAPFSERFTHFEKGCNSPKCVENRDSHSGLHKWRTCTRMTSMNAYSRDLRLKTLAAIDRGIPRKEVSELFGVSLSTIKRWLNRRRLTGDVTIHKIPGRPSVKGKALRQWLPRHLEAKTLTLPSKSIAKPLRMRVA